jgi:gliding motility-associated-like protein
MATHIVGGNFEVKQTARNSFTVELFIYRDARPGSVNLPPTLNVLVYRKSDLAIAQNLTLIRESSKTIELGDGCFTPQDLDFEEHHYVLANVTLADSPGGYVITTNPQFCCRNSLISNIMLFITSGSPRVGTKLTIDIPDPASTLQNSSPDLGPYPNNGYFCINDLRPINLKATDPDGDSLSYELVTPLDTTLGNLLSYKEVIWENGFSLNNAIGGNPPLAIDPVTGELIGSPDNIGVYVFSYIVREYRNGVEIGSVRRDLQFYGLNCETNSPPTIVSPIENNFTTEALDFFCEEILIEDLNSADSIFMLAAFSEPSGASLLSNPQVPSFVSSNGTLSTRLCWAPSCADAFYKNSIAVTITAYSFGCDKIDTVSKNILIDIEPIEDKIEASIPNLFTPNGDGVNDYYEVSNLAESGCFSELEILIFNRWGEKVFESTNPNFKWDGSKNGNPLTAGVYYYLIRGNYASQVFEYKDYMTIIR